MLSSTCNFIFLLSDTFFSLCGCAIICVLRSHRSHVFHCIDRDVKGTHLSWIRSRNSSRGDGWRDLVLVQSQFPPAVLPRQKSGCSENTVISLVVAEPKADLAGLLAREEHAHTGHWALRLSLCNGAISVMWDLPILPCHVAITCPLALYRCGALEGQSSSLLGPWSWWEHHLSPTQPVGCWNLGWFFLLC